MASQTVNPNISISLNKAWFENQGGLYPDVFKGRLTKIADLFQRMSGKMSQSDALQLICQRD